MCVFAMALNLEITIFKLITA